jgi:ATP-dependent RNA helicase RhlE
MEDVTNLSFEQFAFSEPVARGIADAGYTKPTEIQNAALLIVLEKRDVVGLAETGTGKTAAFVLPIIERLIQHQGKGEPRALILAPTRELAEQIHGEIKKLAAYTGLVSITIYGGVRMNPQIERLKKGVDIVVACPGRLLDHLRQKNISLKSVEVLVLDEADRMLDMGFIPDIRRIVSRVPKKRQTLLFSATMPSDIKRLIRDFMFKPETVQVGTLLTARTITHGLYPVPKHLKYELLKAILNRTETESVIVFTRMKSRAADVAHELQADGYSAISLQGDLTQKQRTHAMDGFREGTFKILVATDIAARGIDVTQISHVINYDIPENAEDYTHRTGRTGRAAREGDAFTLVSVPEDISIVHTLEKELNCELHLRELDGFDYEASSSSVKQPGGKRGRFGRGKAKRGGHVKPATGKRSASPGSAKKKGRSRRRGRSSRVEVQTKES